MPTTVQTEEAEETLPFDVDQAMGFSLKSFLDRMLIDGKSNFSRPQQLVPGRPDPATIEICPT
jgi:hypothetical protein